MKEESKGKLENKVTENETTTLQNAWDAAEQLFVVVVFYSLTLYFLGVHYPAPKYTEGYYFS